MNLTTFSSQITALLSSKLLKHPHVQLSSWRRIKEWLEEPTHRQHYLPDGLIHLPIDKKEFKADFHAAHPTPSGRISGADDTVINLMYRLLEEEQ